MIKRLFSTTITLVVIAAMFFFASGAQADSLSLSDYAGFAAYATIGEVNLADVVPAFVMIEYQDLEATIPYFVGTLDLPGYDDVYDPLVLVTAAGDIVAFYDAEDPASKIVDVLSKNLNETLLEKAVKAVATAAGEDTTELAISHCDFRNTAATTLLLVAEYEPDGNAFTLQFGAGNIYAEKSYAFYRTFAPSFTLDNDDIDQVDFVETNADYIGAGYYGTIYGHFIEDDPLIVDDPNIEFGPEILNTFAVEAGDHLGFGALAILYSGDAAFIAADKDFERVIPLVSPEIDPTFDLIPTDFDKVSPGVDATGVELNPTLSWDPSTAPNYEYCIDEVYAVNEDNVDGACDSDWISTGAATSVDLSNLKFETEYEWQVRAVNSDGPVMANDEDWGTFTTEDGVAPVAFSKGAEDLTEPVGALSKVTMTWEESYGAYYYEVCVDTSPACTAPEVWHNVGLATTATIGDLLLDSTYYWQVRAVNYYPSTENVLNITGADSGVWQEFTTRTFSKLRPVDTEVYNVTLPFKWEATPIETDGYEYCIDLTDDDACDDPWVEVSDISVVLGKKDKLDDGTYYWQVRAVTSNDEYVYANPIDEDGNLLPTGAWWSFTVLSRKDSRNLNLFKDSPVDGAVDQPIANLNLSWTTTITNDTVYEYCYFPVDDTDTTPIADDDTCSYDDPLDPYDYKWEPVPVNDLSATIETLDPGVTYYWQVRADLGTSWLYADKGDYWAFTTLPLPE